MAVQFACSSCRRGITISERFMGLRVRCPGCWSVLEVPAPPDGRPAAPEDLPPPATSPPTAGGTETAILLKKCPFCAESILADARKCRHCGELLDRALAVSKEKERVERIKRREGAVRETPWNVWASLICGIVGILPCIGIPFLGSLLGPAAILTGIAAMNEIKENPRHRGRNIALTGIVFGAVALVGSIVGFALIAAGKFQFAT